MFGHALMSWYPISCWLSLMQISKGRLWLARDFMLCLKVFDWEVSFGMTWRTRLNPQTESVRLASSSSWKFEFSGLHAAMTPMRLFWLFLTSSVKNAASWVSWLSTTSTSMKMLPAMEKSLVMSW